jgi:hypothetical protein
MDKSYSYVGLDVHKATIAVANGSSSEVRFVGEIAKHPRLLIN